MTTDLSSRVENREIRDWGLAHGWPDLADRGRVPRDLREAYEAAHPAGITDVGVELVEPDGDLADFDEEGMAADLAALDAAMTEEEELPPPPASLDEARQRAGQDAGSAHLRKGRRARERQPRDQRPVKVTPAVIGDIEGKLAFWLGLTAEPWAVADPYCGGVYADQVPEIARRLAPIVCQSPDLVRWFGKSSTFILWTELGIAVRPVATAVIKHHVTKVVALDSEGQVTDGPGVSAGGVNLSAFTARPAA